MRKLLLSTIITAALIVCNIGDTFAQRIIENPSYDIRASSIATITKIELLEEVTKIYLRCTYSPNWWVSIDEGEYLKVTSQDKIYKIRSVEGHELNKEYFTPECGYQDFVLHYDAIDQDTETIDFMTESGSWNIYGIDLTGKRGEQDKYSELLSVAKGTWSDVAGEQAWCYGFFKEFAIYDNKFWDYISYSKKRDLYTVALKSGDEEIELYIKEQDGLLSIGSNKRELKLYTKENKLAPADGSKREDIEIDPFQSGKMVIQGYIEGYHPSIGSNNAIYYGGSIIKNTDEQTLINIEPDGRFYVEVDVPHASSIFCIFPERNYISALVFPGDTLTIYESWEGMIEKKSHPADIMGYSAGTLRYMGEHATLNNEVELLSRECLAAEFYMDYHYNHSTKSPEEILEITKKAYTQDSTRLEEYIASKKLYNTSKEILRMNLLERHLDILAIHNPSRTDKSKVVDEEGYSYIDRDYLLPSDYHHMWSYLDVSNPLIMLTDLSTLVNRYSFAPFIRFYTYKTSMLACLTYIKSCDGVTAAEIEEITAVEEQASKLNQDSDSTEMAATTDKINALYQLYEDTYIKDYNFEKGHLTQKLEIADTRSMSQSLWGDKENILNQIHNVHKFIRSLNMAGSKAKGEILLDLYRGEITHPYMLDVLDEIMVEHFKEDDAIVLKECPGKELFEELIAPYRGNYIMIDFWETSCSPCIAGIKNGKDRREELKGKNIVFMFIASETGSHPTTYENIMKDVEGVKHKLSESDHNKIVELFNISSIPRYVMVNPQGEVIDDHYGRRTLFDNEIVNNCLTDKK